MSAVLARQASVQTIRRRTAVSLQEKNFWASSGVLDPVEIKKLAECRNGSIGRRQGGWGGDDANDNGHGGTTRF